MRFAALLLVVLLPAGSSCCSRPKPPPPPDLVERVKDKTAATLDVLIEGAEEEKAALRALVAARPGITTWSGLVTAWKGHTALAGIDLDRQIIELLRGDDGWVAAAREAHPPDGNVPDHVFLDGFFKAVSAWLTENQG